MDEVRENYQTRGVKNIFEAKLEYAMYEYNISCATFEMPLNMRTDHNFIFAVDFTLQFIDR